MATTTVLKRDATTSGPIKIPAWAPSIAWIGTTTTHDQANAFMVPATTWVNIYPFNPNGGYNRRCFGAKQALAVDFEAGNTITLRYRAIGELVQA